VKGPRGVFITGIGIVSPIGNSISAFLTALKSSNSGIRPIEGFDTAVFRSHVHAPVQIETLKEPSDPGDTETWDRHLQFGYFALRDALRDASIERNSLQDRTGLICATCSGPMLTIEAEYLQTPIVPGAGMRTDSVYREYRRYYLMERTLVRVFGISGFSTTVVTACAASSNAIGLGADLIAEGILDHVFVVGSDAFAPSTFAGFDFLKATCITECAPFSEPAGMNLGEGAGAWVLENGDAAKRRGARIRGQILGYGLSNDAYHATAPDPQGEGAILAMTRAMHDARIDPASIGYINAHGTGTMPNDRTESKAITRVFIDRLPPPVSSSKSFFGHALGAAGILEASASLLMMNDGLLPPTLRFTTARDGCGLDYVPNIPRATDATVFLSNNFAFAGNNSALVIATNHSEVSPAAHPVPDDTVITGFSSLTPADANDPSDPRSFVFDGNRVIQMDRRLPLKEMDLSSQLATLVSKRAVQHAELSLKPSDARQIGLILGLCDGPNRGEAAHLRSIAVSGLSAPNLVMFPYIVLNSVAGQCSRALGLKGFSSTLCGAPGAGLHALIYAALAIRRGHALICLACGVDERQESYSYVDESSHEDAGIEDRPVSDGAACLVLESAASAAARKAKILGRWLGWRCVNLSSDRSALNIARELEGFLSELNQSDRSTAALVIDADYGVEAKRIEGAAKRISDRIGARMISGAEFGSARTLSSGVLRNISIALSIPDGSGKMVLTAYLSSAGQLGLVALLID